MNGLGFKVGDWVVFVCGTGTDIVTTSVKVVELLDRDRARVAVRNGGWLVVPVRSLVPPASPRLASPARIDDHATSIAAAESQRAGLTSNQFLVLGALADAGDVGMTDHEHEPVNGLHQDTAGKRRGELLAVGLVADSGRTRLSPRHRKAKVWQITAAGQLVWAQHARNTVSTPAGAA